ncbi:MAG TPA: hypothetical protein PKD55_01455 [Bellilinea sp.]|nr:hypothetical protein [Bellilinea sp.]
MEVFLIGLLIIAVVVILVLTRSNLLLRSIPTKDLVEIYANLALEMVVNEALGRENSPKNEQILMTVARELKRRSVL